MTGLPAAAEARFVPLIRETHVLMTVQAFANGQGRYASHALNSYKHLS